MIQADLHLHTLYSHGANTPSEMFGAAKARGLSIIGFSEHSPRPEGFNYRREYREQLRAHLNDYVNEVLTLKNADSSCRVLFGMEIDWLAGAEDFTSRSCAAYDFDYLIGSVHFLDRWGFDDGDEPWRGASQERCEEWYRAYFEAWLDMIESGLFNIAAHPDLIKIFSVDRFHIWLAKPESMELVKKGLRALKNRGMAMEISSAGLRKACGEPYPCAPIMRAASELELPISLASDAHNVNDVAGAFTRLASYARAFGFREQTIFDHGKIIRLPF